MKKVTAWELVQALATAEKNNLYIPGNVNKLTIEQMRAWVDATILAA